VDATPDRLIRCRASHHSLWPFEDVRYASVSAPCRTGAAHIAFIPRMRRCRKQLRNGCPERRALGHPVPVTQDLKGE
jgi:hypothetical protein